ncbi:MAG: hypothetical protein HC893_06365 [Chloroflexaceae bacterium]|nr:hypothetical protein [Chloroflexaceae bacterium]
MTYQRPRTPLGIALDRLEAEEQHRKEAERLRRAEERIERVGQATRWLIQLTEKRQELLARQPRTATVEKDLKRLRQRIAQAEEELRRAKAGAAPSPADHDSQVKPRRYNSGFK